jgi:DNA-binding GntR family transcriptional regulator
MDLVNGYGVSRTPVREALKVLNHEGLLTLANRRGMVVTELGQHERQEALQLYRLLCTYAANEVADVYECTRPSLLRRLLQLVECQLRLAYGPSFEDEMQRLGVSRPHSLHSAWLGKKTE